MGQQASLGYVDLQVNGYIGVDFNDPQTPLERLRDAAVAMQRDGVDVAWPTVITAAPDVMERCLQNLTHAIGRWSEVAAVFRGLHIEGPFLSPETGYIGAHPVNAACKQDLHLLDRLLAAGADSQGNCLVRLVTLAPEIDAGGAMTAELHARGIRIAAGHTDASCDQIEVCLKQGLELFTHLGNGCPREMHRHDNIIFRALRYRDRLRYSLVADGFHVPAMLFELLLQWVDSSRFIVVSDAICAAGLGPGEYRLGERTVQVGKDGAARDASGQHFVGAATTLAGADDWLCNRLGLDASQRRALLRYNALCWLGKL